MAKKRVSLTLSEKIVEKIDNLAEKQGENRSRTIEAIVQEHLAKNQLSKAVVFCGDPDAECLKNHKNTSIIEKILEHLAENKIEKVYLLCGENEQKIKSVCGNQHGQTQIKYVSEEKPKGTAPALKQLQNEISETFLAVNGHVLTDVDIKDMYKAHRNAELTATIALTSVENPSGYGVARLKGDKILGFEEKPEKGEAPSNLINAGTYIVEPQIFQELDSGSIGEVFEQLAHEKRLAGYIYGGKWIDAAQ